MTSVPGLVQKYPDIAAGKLINAKNITDIILITSKDLVPAGYTKLERTKTNRRCSLHAHGPDQGFFLCVQRDLDTPPVTGISLTCDEHAESVAPGYVRVERTPSGRWAGMRSDKDGSRVFLCIKHGGSSPPIVDIDFMASNKSETLAPNFVSVSRSPAGRDVKISSAKGGGALSLCYRQQVLELGAASSMPALGNMIRALYTHDTTIVRHCFQTLQSIVKSSALFPDSTSSTSNSILTSSNTTTTTPPTPPETQTKYPLSEQPANSTIASCFVSAVCDMADDAPNEHLKPIFSLLETFVQNSQFLSTANVVGPPRALLRIVGTMTFLKATYGGHTTTSNSVLVRDTLNTVMSTLMQRVDMTNPLGVDHVVERRLRAEAHLQSQNDGPVEYALELILARVHELKSAMMAAHDAVVASLTLGGSKSSSAIAPYSHVWRQQMNVIGRRLYPGHAPPRDVFNALAFLCQACHVDVPMEDSHGSGGGGSGTNSSGELAPTRQSDIRTKVYALQSLRILLENSGIGFRQGDRSGLVVRGLVVQVILENCSYPSMDVFREVLGLLTVLWTFFRRHLKVELTILFNDVLLRVLRSPHAPMEKKIEVLEQLINHWFAQPANLVELYLNFDNDQVEVSDANIYSGLCEVLCALAEGRLSSTSSSSSMASNTTNSSSSSSSSASSRKGDHNNDRMTRRRLRRVALDALARVTRCLMDTSATVHLIRRHSNRDSIESIDTSPILKHAGANSPVESMGWEQDEESTPVSNAATRSSLLHTSTHVRSSLEVSTNGDDSRHARTYSPYGTATMMRGDNGDNDTELLPGLNISPNSPELGGGRESISSNESGGGTPGNSPVIGIDTTDSSSLTPSSSSSFSSSSSHHRRMRSQSDMGPTTLSLGNHRLSPSSNVPMSTRHSVAVGAPLLTRRASVRVRHEQQQNKQKNVEKALELASKKSLKKAFRLLVDSGHVHPTPNAFVTWIRDHIDSIDENQLGDYLGDGGEEKVSPSGVVARSTETIDFFTSLRNIFMSGLPFQSVGFVDALRHMLTQSGFRMPGEAQKVSRFLEAFALCYYTSNKDSSGAESLDKDKCEILAFATVMLNTDQYNPAIKAKKKMTLKQFKSNMRGMGISDSFLETVYADILAEQILMPIPGQPDAKEDDNTSETGDDPTVELSLFYRSMQNAAQRARAKLISHSSMCRVYFTKMSTELVNLMFEISWPFFYRCITVVLDEQDKSERQHASSNSGTASTADEVNHLELVACVLDLLRYSISACLCLSMETERRAFAALLAKFHFLHSNSGEWDSVGDVMMFGHENDDVSSAFSSSASSSASSTAEQQSSSSLSSGNGKGRNEAAQQNSFTRTGLKRGTTMTKDLLSGKHLEQTWFKHVMQTSAHDSDAVMDVISEVHQLASKLKDRVLIRHRSKFLYKLCHDKFIKKDAEQILSFGHIDNSGKNNSGGRVLMKEGILVRHTQTGREKKYRFFLFNDLFLYASGGRSKLKVHNYLPLDTLTVKEAPQDSDLDASVSFQIESPVKSFAISALTPSKKIAWMEAIEHACRQQEIDRMEEEKKSMMERATEKVEMEGRVYNTATSAANGASGVGSDDGGGGEGGGGGETKRGNRGHQTLGSKRISMMDRFQATQLASLKEATTIKQSTRRQSTIIAAPIINYGEDAFVEESEVLEEEEEEERETKVKEINVHETDAMSDKEILKKFQIGLKFSKSILEGSHKVRYKILMTLHFAG